MLIVFPLGLFVAAVIFDLVRVLTGDDTFGEVGYWNIAAGLVGAVLAAATGLADWTAIPAGTRARRIGLLHGAGNTVVLLLFLVSWLLRMDETAHVAGPGVFALEVVAIGIGAAAAWLGGELVDRLGIGVDEDANPDAPSSLSGRPKVG